VKPRTTTDNLFDLKHPPNSFISVPRMQRNAENANYSHLVYELTPKGAQALVEHSRISYAEYLLWTKVREQYRIHHYDHSLTTGYVTASIALGCRDRGLAFLSWLDLLNREKCPQDTRDAINPFGIPYGTDTTRYLTPDAIFGIEYGNGACFFAVETDMGTEQQSERKGGGTSITQKVKAYREIIHRQTFKEYLGLPSLQVIFATTSVIRLHNIFETVLSIASKDGKGSTRPFLGKAPTEIAYRTHQPLPATGHILAEPFLLAHGKTIDISKV